MGQALGRAATCARIPNASRLHDGIARLLGLALFGLTFFVSSPAQPDSLVLPASTKALGSSGRAEPIRAWTELCRNMPNECGVDQAESRVISLTAEVWKALVRVNREVNDTIKAVSDRDHWGVEDRWNLPDDGEGDCEDMQLLKRKMLIEAGLPRRAMRMTVVIDEEGGGHAVMMVRTDRGDLILDNRRSSILPWTQTGYIYVKAEGADGLEWMSFGGATSAIVTANRDQPPTAPASPAPPARLASR